MENTDQAIQQEETTPVVIKETSKTNDEQPVVPETIDEQPVSENTVSMESEPVVIETITDEDTSAKKAEETSVEENKDEEEKPVEEIKDEEEKPVEGTQDEEEKPEKTTSTDEQENVNDVTSTATTSVSPNRANVPLKEVNESEKEASEIMTNGTDSSISKKRELEQEDDKTDVNTDNDERSGDQAKKIKIAEATDTPIIETKEAENNNIVNGCTAVEV